MANSIDSKHGTSDEFFDPFCDVCAKTKNINFKPEGYCHECYQCLCKDCLKVHKSLPATSNHMIRTGEDMPKSQKDKPPKFEYCDVHQRNPKDQFCSEHRFLVCFSCVPLLHKDCSVESVEDAAKNIPPSEIDLFYDTVSDFKTQLLFAESRMESNAKDLRGQRTKILKEIQEIYDKTKSKLDKFFQDTKSDLESKYQCESSVLVHDQKNIKDVSVKLDSTLNGMIALKGNTIDTKAFLKIQDLLKNIDKCKMDVSTLNQTTTRKVFNFVPDKTMNNFLSTSFKMGTISIEDSKRDVTIYVPEIIFPVSPTKQSQGSTAGHPSSGNTKPISEIKAQKCSKYNISLRDDKKDCYITGLAVTLGGRRLLADRDKKKINMFSEYMKIISSLALPSTPWDIAVTGDKEAVVSVLLESKLFILDLSDKQMSVRRTVKLSFVVGAIATCKDRLVVTSLVLSPSVKLIDKSGKIYWSTSTDQQGHELFSVPRYVTCYDDGRSSTVIVTDSRNHTMTLLNSDTGGVISRRRVEGKGPHGVTTDTAGNIYVCYWETGEVAVLAKDLSEENILLTRRDGISEFPLAIVYDAEDHRLLVSNDSQDSRNDVDCFHLL